MTPFTVFEESTGRILRSGIAPNENAALAQAGPNEGTLLAPADDAIGYVLDGALVQRPEIDLPEIVNLTINGVLTVSNAPAGAEILVDGSLVGLTDGFGLDVSFEFDGEYSFEIRVPFPYRPAKSKVKVSP